MFDSRRVDCLNHISVVVVDVIVGRQVEGIGTVDVKERDRRAFDGDGQFRIVFGFAVRVDVGDDFVLRARERDLVGADRHDDVVAALFERGRARSDVDNVFLGVVFDSVVAVA